MLKCVEWKLIMYQENSVMIFLKRIMLLLGAVLFFTVSCGQSNHEGKISELQQWMSSNGKLKVLCTTAMVAEIVRDVGKEYIDCLTLIQGESDPHSYQLVKGDDEKLARADLIFYNGLGLEHGPSLAQRLENNSKAVSVGEFIAKARPADIILFNGSVDPHVWMDVSLWQSAVPFIAEILTTAIPEQGEFFQQMSNETSISLQKLHRDILKRISLLPESSRYIVSAHEAFNYFVRAYLATEEERKNSTWTIRSMAPEGLAPDSQLSTADIQRLVDHIVKYNVRTLFAESNISRDSLKKLTDACLRKGYAVHVAKEPLYVDAMGPVGSPAATYKGMMQYDSETIYNGLSKNGLD